jgi:hypothetical protein
VPVTLVSISGLSVPAATPPAMPEVRNKLDAMGGRAAPSSAEEYTQALLAEVAATEQMMKAARLEPQ